MNLRYLPLVIPQFAARVFPSLSSAEESSKVKDISQSPACQTIQPRSRNFLSKLVNFLSEMCYRRGLLHGVSMA